MPAETLSLKVRQVRTLQKKHGIQNLLNPTPEDGPKLANVDFLIDLYFEGSRSWEKPPTLEALEDLDVKAELFPAVKRFLGTDEDDEKKPEPASISPSGPASSPKQG